MSGDRQPQELLTILSAKVQQFYVVDGAIPLFTPADVAHILGNIKLPEAAIVYARLKVAGEGDASDLVDEFFRYIAAYHPISGWRVPRPGFVRQLCKLALNEHIDPMICLWCGGTKVEVNSGKLENCGECYGSGKRKIQDRDRAAAMEVSPSAWAHSWAKKYDQLIYLLDAWEDAINGAIAKRKGSASTASIASTG